MPSLSTTGIGTTNAASRWRAVRTNRSVMPGSSAIIAKAAWSPMYPTSGSVVVTVAVRGLSRNNAISPTITPAETSSRISTPSSPTCRTSARPDWISRKDTARSPCRIRTCPAAARNGRSSSASGNSSSAEHPSNTSISASASARSATTSGAAPSADARP